MFIEQDQQRPVPSCVPEWAERLLASGNALPSPERNGLALGVTELDRSLPDGGLPRGALSEIFSPEGAHLTLLLLLMAQLTQADKKVALISNSGSWYPPALARAGVDLHNLLLITPERHKDLLWASEQCFRSQAIALTVSQLRGVSEMDMRRYALKLEQGGGVGVLLRPINELHSCAASALRLVVQPWKGRGSCRSFHIEVARCRGTMPPKPVTIEVNDHGTTMALSLSAELRLSAGTTREAIA